MRLELILRQVNPEEFKKPLVCPHKQCQCRHLEYHQIEGLLRADALNGGLTV